MNTSENHEQNGSRPSENRHAVVLGGSLAGLLARQLQQPVGRKQIGNQMLHHVEARD